jgi:hypothetical protein
LIGNNVSEKGQNEANPMFPLESRMKDPCPHHKIYNIASDDETKEVLHVTTVLFSSLLRPLIRHLRSIDCDCCHKLNEQNAEIEFSKKKEATENSMR